MKYLSPKFRLMRHLAFQAGWGGYDWRQHPQMQAWMDEAGELNIEKLREHYTNRKKWCSSEQVDRAVDKMREKGWDETPKPDSLMGGEVAKAKLTIIENFRSNYIQQEQDKLPDKRPFTLGEKEAIRNYLNNLEY